MGILTKTNTMITERLEDLIGCGENAPRNSSKEHQGGIVFPALHPDSASPYSLHCPDMEVSFPCPFLLQSYPLIWKSNMLNRRCQLSSPVHLTRMESVGRCRESSDVSYDLCITVSPVTLLMPFCPSFLSSELLCKPVSYN